MKNTVLDNSMIDHVLELFEQQWTADDHGLIARLLGEQRADLRDELLQELLRADIGRRYAAGHDVDLEVYFQWFPEITNSSEATAAICFEDFRTRRHRGRSLPAGRWSRYPAVKDRSWLIELQSASVDLESSAVFQSNDSLANASLTAAAPSGVSSHLSNDSEMLGDFELVALLGQGAFSKVYLARQTSLGGRYVAVKVVRQPLREASHLARLQHTGIVPLYSCHRAQDKWILCMPYSGSATLADWLKGEAVPASRTGQSLVTTIHNAQNRITEAGSEIPGESDLSSLNKDQKATLQAWHSAATQPLQQLSTMSAPQFSLWMAHRLAGALSHAHQRGIVHGDLKPANILFRNDGEPALIDFNLSQVADTSARSWRGGTFPYMAGEQLKAIIAHTKGPAREQADVFALGVILFEIVEGRLPFGVPASLAETDLQMAVQQRTTLPEFRERHSCTDGLRSIIHKCLAPDPADRYSNAGLLLEDLDCEIANLPLRHARESFVRGSLPKLTRRFPRLFSGGSISLAALLLIGILLNILFTFQRRSERLASLEAIKSFEDLSNQKFARFLRAGASSSDKTSIFAPDDLKSIRKLVSDHLSPSVDLSTDERNTAEERLMALSFLEAYRALRSADHSDSSRQQLQTLIELLPKSVQETRTGHLIQEIAKGSTALFVTKDDITNSGKLTSADQALAALTFLQSQPRKSLELLEALEVPDSLRLIYWMTRGRALLEIGEPQRAVSAFTMAMRDSSASDISWNRGLAYFRAGSLAESDADFTTFIRQSQNDVSGYLNRYTVRMAMGRIEEAMHDLNRAIELQPESARLRLIRSRELRNAGKLKAAKDDFDAAMKSHPASIEDWLSVALAKLPTDPAQALKDLESAETLFGADPSILQTMAHVLSEHLQRPKDAIRALDRVLQMEPEFQKALSGRAVLNARLGKVESAIADVERLESLEATLTSEAVYQMACSVALCSKTQSDLKARALSLLARAVHDNYGGELMGEDTDLDAIRDMPEFDIIIKNFQLVSNQHHHPESR